MKLKKKIKSLDEVGQQFHHLYTKVGSEFVIQIEEIEDDETSPEEPEVDPKKSKDSERLAEFRSNNIKLKKERDEALAKLQGIDMELLEAGKHAVEKARNEEERKLLAVGKFDDVFNMRLAGLQGEFGKKEKAWQIQLEGEQKKAAKYKGSLKMSKIESELMREAADAKLRLQTTGVRDFVRRAFDVFDLDDNGELVALDAEGNPRLTKDQKPYGKRDFIMEVVEEAPHLLESANGTDVNGSPRRRQSGVVEIDANDPKSFGGNIENIAKGKINVRVNQ